MINPFFNKNFINYFYCCLLGIFCLCVSMVVVISKISHFHYSTDDRSPYYYSVIGSTLQPNLILDGDLKCFWLYIYKKSSVHGQRLILMIFFINSIFDWYKRSRENSIDDEWKEIDERKWENKEEGGY